MGQRRGVAGVAGPWLWARFSAASLVFLSKKYIPAKQEIRMIQLIINTKVKPSICIRSLRVTKIKADLLFYYNPSCGPTNQAQIPLWRWG